MVCCKERALLHEANERSALQQSSHASVTRECHKHCQVPNVTKIFKMTIEMKRCINPCSKRCKQHYLQQKRLDNIARPKLVRVPCWRRFFSRQLSIFTGSCFACGISLPLCFIIAQVPKQKKHMEPSSSKLMLLVFFPTVRRALFLVHACPVLTSWLGKDRMMDSLKRFFFNKKILKFKKGWEKIGFGIPLFGFFQIKNLDLFFFKGYGFI